MSKPMYTIGEFAKLTQVTERTLRFYDKKALLKPSQYNEQGHRLYSEQDLIKLQKILTLKYLGFTLEEIAEHLNNPAFDLQRSLSFQHQALMKKREQLDHVISTLERVLYIVEETNQLDANHLLALIFSIQMESKQKEWFMERFSKSTVEALFMEGREEERLEFERQSMRLIAEIQQFAREGKSPRDPAVQEKCIELLEQIAVVMKPEILHELTDRIDELEASQDMLFPPFLQEEDVFIQEAFEFLDASQLSSRIVEFQSWFGKDDTND